MASPLGVLQQPRTIIATVLVGEALALLLALAAVGEVDRWVYFGLASMFIQWVLLLTLGLTLLACRTLSSLHPTRLAAVVLGLLLACTWLVGFLAWMLFRHAWPFLGDAGPDIFLRLTGITFTIGFLGLAAFQNHWQAKQLAVRAKQAELESLQARTHPHFLFNTLNTGAALVHARPEAAETLLLDLADLFRAALTGPSHIELNDEIDLVRRYLAIEQLRLDRRLHVCWEIPETLPDIKVPSLSLQPLVENAVRHGIEPRVDGGKIHILIVCDRDWLHMTVRNDMPEPNGCGNTAGHQIGLASVEHRIQEMTGGAGSLTTSARNGIHSATIKMPAPCNG